jgi:hypothetical protein
MMIVVKKKTIIFLAGLYLTIEIIIEQRCRNSISFDSHKIISSS